MFSPETWFALFLVVTVNVIPLTADDPGTGSWLQLPIAAIVMFPALRSSLQFVFACENKRLSGVRAGVLRSQYALSLDVTLRKSFPAPVIDVPIPGLGVARVRFFADRQSVWMRLRLKSRALDRAPWLRLQGAASFWLPTPAVGAKALTIENAKHKWRYWKLPRGDAYSTLENPDFRKALASTQRPLVFTTRPGRLQIRGACDTGGSMLLRDAVRLAIAWVAALQQTPGARAHAGLPDSQRDAPTEAASRAPGSAGSCVGHSTR